MCSKCYKDYVQRKANTTGVMGRASPSMTTAGERSTSLQSPFVNVVSSSAPSGISVDQMRALIANEACSSSESRTHSTSMSVGSNEQPAVATEKSTDCKSDEAGVGGNAPAPKPSNRCGQCQKKVGLTGFGCRCGGTFCGEHRYSDRHACQFDYKQRGVEELRKMNPVVVAEKVSKI